MLAARTVFFVLCTALALSTESRFSDSVAAYAPLLSRFGIVIYESDQLGKRGSLALALAVDYPRLMEVSMRLIDSQRRNKCLIEDEPLLCQYLSVEVGLSSLKWGFQTQWGEEDMWEVNDSQEAQSSRAARPILVSLMAVNAEAFLTTPRATLGAAAGLFERRMREICRGLLIEIPRVLTVKDDRSFFTTTNVFVDLLKVLSMYFTASPSVLDPVIKATLNGLRDVQNDPMFDHLEDPTKEQVKLVESETHAVKWLLNDPNSSTQAWKLYLLVFSNPSWAADVMLHAEAMVAVKPDSPLSMDELCVLKLALIELDYHRLSILVSRMVFPPGPSMDSVRPYEMAELDSLIGKVTDILERQRMDASTAPLAVFLSGSETASHWLTPHILRLKMNVVSELGTRLQSQHAAAEANQREAYEEAHRLYGLIVADLNPRL